MKYRINLLPAKQLTALDRIIFFAFNYLRYILVITQLVVICVFLYRFNIDQEIVDTKDTLHQKQEIIRVSQPLLLAGDKLYKRSENISSLLDSQSKESRMFEYVLSRFPEQFFLNEMNITVDSMTLKGSTPDANILRGFYTRLKSDQKFNSVNLQNISKTDKGYDFTFILGGFI